MKIIENNSNIKEAYPKRVRCNCCDSVLEIDKNDLFVGAYGAYYTKCPICKNKIIIDDGEDLTLDNLKFPDHFANFANGVDISPDRIKAEIARGVKYLRENPGTWHWFSEFGNTHIGIYNNSDDREFRIVVAKGYYETVIDW